MKPFLAFLLPLARAAPQISWVSQPVLPGETIVLTGFGFSNSSQLLLKPLSRGPSLSLEALQASPDGAVLNALLPATAPLAAYEIVVKDASGASQAARLNVPDVYWAHGDEHEAATPGGFLRVFGKALFFEGKEREALAEAERLMEEALRAGAPEAGELAVRAARLRRALKEKELPTLRLEKAGKSLQMKAESATGYAALFRLPKEMDVGEYKLSFANNIAPEEFSEMLTFLSPARPRVSTVKVVAKVPWPAKRFTVTEYDEGIGRVPRNGEKYWKDASPAFQKALEAAEKAGGGVVYFPRGQYFLNSSAGFTIPWNVQVLGESRETVSLYMAELNMSTAPKAFFRSPGTLSIDPNPEKAGTGRWSIEGVTIYVTGFHNWIFLLNNRTTGWSMHRCRLQANAYLGSGGEFTSRDPWSWKNWTLEQPGAAIGLNNCRNWQITENHLYSTYDVIQSAIHSPVCKKSDMSGCHGAAWGWVADNSIWNGGCSHFMNQWNQVIFERNTINGVSPIAMGQSVGTGPGGGYDQNLYHGENSIRFVHGNDREMITFDNAGGAYLGTLANVQGTKITFAYDARSAGSPEWGGWAGAAMVVLNGTGVGQWRRVVLPGIDVEPWNANNRTWELDRAFEIAPGKDSVVQVMPFRGRIIFHGDVFMDGGNIQLYGQAIDVVTVNCVTERAAGFAAWGQWRGCYEFKYCAGHGLGVTGEAGNGVMPNLQVQYINNTVVEGNKVVRWTARDSGGSIAPGLGAFMGGATFMILGASHTLLEGLYTSMNIIFRRNKVWNNGGFNLAYGSPYGVRDVLLEGSIVENSAADRALQLSSNLPGLVLRDNKLPSQPAAKVWKELVV